MRSIRWEYSLTLIFVLISLILLVLLAVQAYYGQQYREQYIQELLNVKSAGFEMQELPSYHVSDYAIDDYAEIVERPLFFKGRRPVDPEDVADTEVTTATVPKELGLKLIGVIKTPENAYALFNDPRAKPDEDKFPRLKRGEKIKGWLVQEIKPDRVIMVANGDTEEILLAKPRPKAPLRLAGKRLRQAQKPKTRRKKTPPPNPFSQLLKK